MPRIYISHFPHDTSRNEVDIIRHRFSKVMGVENILDTTMIESEVTIERQKAVWSCNGLIIVLGRYALNMVDEKGNRVIEDPYEPVHIEIDAGLRSGLQIVVLVVDGAPKLVSSQIPEPLQLLLTQATHYQIYNDAELEHILDDLAQVNWNSIARIKKRKKPVSLTTGYEHMLADNPIESRYGVQNANNTQTSLSPRSRQSTRNQTASSNKDVSLIAGYEHLLADDPIESRYGLQDASHNTTTSYRPRHKRVQPFRSSNKDVSLTAGYEHLLADNPEELTYGVQNANNKKASRSRLSSRRTSKKPTPISRPLVEGYDRLLADDPAELPYGASTDRQAHRQSQSSKGNEGVLLRFMDKLSDWFS